MRRFDACALCLQRAREPLACHEGHLFCKECVYTDLCEFTAPLSTHLQCSPSTVTQKKDIKRQKGKLELLKREAEEERSRAKEAARERVLLEFEKGQRAAAPSSVLAATTSGKASEDRKHIPSRLSRTADLSPLR